METDLQQKEDQPVGTDEPLVGRKDGQVVIVCLNLFTGALLPKARQGGESRLTDVPEVWLDDTACGCEIDSKGYERTQRTQELDADEMLGLAVEAHGYSSQAVDAGRHMT